MRKTLEQGRHWLAQVEADLDAAYYNFGAGGAFKLLGEDAPILDAYYLSSRYPDSLPGGIPAQTFGRNATQTTQDISKQILDLTNKEMHALNKLEEEPMRPLNMHIRSSIFGDAVPESPCCW